MNFKGLPETAILSRHLGPTITMVHSENLSKIKTQSDCKKYDSIKSRNKRHHMATNACFVTRVTFGDVFFV